MAGAQVFDDGSDPKSRAISPGSHADGTFQQRRFIRCAQDFAGVAEFAGGMDNRPTGGFGEHGFVEIGRHGTSA